MQGTPDIREGSLGSRRRLSRKRCALNIRARTPSKYTYAHTCTHNHGHANRAQAGRSGPQSTAPTVVWCTQHLQAAGCRKGGQPRREGHQSDQGHARSCRGAPGTPTHPACTVLQHVSFPAEPYVPADGHSMHHRVVLTLDPM